MTGRRILVTGAAGRLGRHVVQQLAAAGNATTALVAVDDDVTPIAAYVDRVVRGDAGDPAVAADAVVGVDEVAHLAAIPSPTGHPPHLVFGQNTMATFAILDAATRADVAVAVIASSIAASGMSFSPHDVRPPYLPLDESMPPQTADPYALSKTTDEATAAMMSRRSGMTTTALRLPYLGTPDDRLPAHAEFYTDRPDQGVRDGWSYLDTRDAARGIVLALGRSGGDSMVIGLAAPTTLTPYPTEQLIDAFLADVPRRRAFAGRCVPLDLTRAEEILGFFAQHEWPMPDQSLPDVADILRRPLRPA